MPGVMGWCATATALGQLIVNPNRGYRIDRTTGDLLWWKNRTARSDRDSGRIHPSRVVRIRLDLRDQKETVTL